MGDLIVATFFGHLPSSQERGPWDALKSPSEAFAGGPWLCP